MASLSWPDAIRIASNFPPCGHTAHWCVSQSHLADMRAGVGTRVGTSLVLGPCETHLLAFSRRHELSVVLLRMFTLASATTFAAIRSFLDPPPDSLHSCPLRGVFPALLRRRRPGFLAFPTAVGMALPSTGLGAANMFVGMMFSGVVLAKWSLSSGDITLRAFNFNKLSIFP